MTHKDMDLWKLSMEFVGDIAMLEKKVIRLRCMMANLLKVLKTKVEK